MIKIIPITNSFQTGEKCQARSEYKLRVLQNKTLTIQWFFIDLLLRITKSIKRSLEPQVSFLFLSYVVDRGEKMNESKSYLQIYSFYFFKPSEKFVEKQSLKSFHVSEDNVSPRVNIF